MPEPRTGVLYNQYEPNDKDRHTVTTLKMFGHTHEEIATYLDMDDMTLVKYYQPELDKACINANTAVANKLYKKATQKEDLQAIIFWLKTRARWKEAKDETPKDTLVELLIKQLAKENGLKEPE